MYRLVVYKEKCHGCGNCVIVCPVNAKDPNVFGGKGPEEEDKVVVRVVNGVADVINEELCGGCGACVEACPVYAIKLIVE
ncbi:MAG TPA: 4Fe-4S dicluster domain-containing protein [Methanothermococcus okinawensis]|uniref:4Fe-4S dicluster domain-containing protein n=1 Tax=Methanothermococcus okinawensis TaxID=155863 RepID=A0A832ZK69_9EURY|nr:4Fe-4S dicluster domain-containing protein [Methanothermococcus okinawensis]HIP91753.1 4Fe-4S dicluster domain-containing protein [Methanothermococcus okinawensis]